MRKHSMRRYTSSQDAAPNGHAFHNQNGMGEAWRTRPHVETVGSEVRASGPPLFALMLGAFAMVIVLGVGGMFMMVGITIGHEMATLRSQYANLPSPMASPF